MDQKREELSGGKAEMRQASLDLGIEMLGQEPEGMRFFEAPAFALLRDAVQMSGRLAGELDSGHERQQVAQQAVEEQVTGTVSEGVNPLAHGGMSRTPLGQLPHQAPPAKTDEQVEGEHLLQETDDETAIGMEKVGQQGMGATTRRAPYTLHGQPVIGFPGDGHACVAAPTNQGPGSLTIGVWALLGDREHGAMALASCDVFFDGTEKWLYNDHELGTPPLVVRPGSSEPRREVSSFLLKVSAQKRSGHYPRPCRFRQAWYASWCPTAISTAIKQSDQTFCFCHILRRSDHLFWPKTALS